ncbi:hypothetical protein [Neobacillus niacini]|nr:hypothetical protein [Neobacillus niacini]
MRKIDDVEVMKPKILFHTPKRTSWMAHEDQNLIEIVKMGLMNRS